MAHISLIVRLIYGGKKALNIAADANEGVRILREDLLHLKIPQPKRENTTIISNETIGGPRGYEFFWPMVQQFGVSHFKSTFNFGACSLYLFFVTAAA
jgi:hypothetical protein